MNVLRKVRSPDCDVCVACLTVRPNSEWKGLCSTGGSTRTSGSGIAIGSMLMWCTCRSCDCSSPLFLSFQTHTMMGNAASPGLTIQAIHQIFATIEQDSSSLYLLRCSMLEIYMEECNDLLNSNPKSGKNLPLRESAGQFRVSGLTEQIVTTAKEVFEWIERGNNNRKVGVSNLNERSSRSHSIFRLTLESAIKTNGTAATGQNKNKLAGAVKVSELNLVDCQTIRAHTRARFSSTSFLDSVSYLTVVCLCLHSVPSFCCLFVSFEVAGSETLSYDFGDSQQKETKAINLSLTQLKTVITALSKQEAFVPFRNSALTKLLRVSLGGNAKTVLVCTLNPMPVHTRTTRNTLSFGQTAASVQNRAKVNEVVDDTGVLLKQQQAKIAALEVKLESLSALEEEKARIQREYLALQRHLSDLQRKEAEHADLKRQMSEANRQIVGGDTINLFAPITVSTVSEEELAVLSSQLADLQHAKTALEQSKFALEQQLQAQIATQQATAAEIAAKQEALESILSKAESDQVELANMSRLLREKESEDAALHAQLTEQAAVLQAKNRESDMLSVQLHAAKAAMAATERDLAARTEEHHRLTEEQRLAADRLQRQVDAQHSELASKTAALAALESEQKAALDSFSRQMATLEDARRKNIEQESKMSQLLAEQSRKEAMLRAQAAEMERQAAHANQALQSNIDKLSQERNRLQSERNELTSLNAAAKDRWDREMRLQSESGLDKDSYLARLMDRYEQEQHQLRTAVSEAESLRLAQQLAMEDELAKVKRQLAAAQASIANENQADLQSPPPPSVPPFPQPSGVSSSSPLPSLVLPGLIDLRESDELLSTPLTNLPLCAACSSRDRLKAEKMRNLCNHARKTLDGQFKQIEQLEHKVKEQENSIAIYQMQINEYAIERQR